MHFCRHQQLLVQLGLGGKRLHSSLGSWFFAIEPFRFTCEHIIDCRNDPLQARRGKLLRACDIDCAHVKVANRKPGSCDNLRHYFGCWYPFYVGVIYFCTNFLQPVLFSCADKAYLLTERSSSVSTHNTYLIRSQNTCAVPC